MRMGKSNSSYGENTKEEASGELIDQGDLRGKGQVEEYIYEFLEGRKPYGENRTDCMLICQLRK